MFTAEIPIPLLLIVKLKKNNPIYFLTACSLSLFSSVSRGADGEVRLCLRLWWVKFRLWCCCNASLSPGSEDRRVWGGCSFIAAVYKYSPYI